MNRIVKSVDYDYVKMKKLIDALCCRNDCLTQFNIGKSCLGRDVTAIKINPSDEYVLLTAAFHGSEHITSNVLLMFIEEFAHAFAKKGSLAGINVKKALGNRGVIFVPRVNVDGCDVSINGALGCGKKAGDVYQMCRGDFAHFNANLRGVDINHNFDAGWKDLHALERKAGILGPSATRYGGEHAHSEPETMAIVKLCEEYNICHALALHSQGEVIYWSYNGLNILHPSAGNLFMSIDDNITHLKEQKKLLEFSLHSHMETKSSIERELTALDATLLTLRRLAHALRSDLYTTTDADTSEAIMLKKIEISRSIEQYTKLQDSLDQFMNQLKDLSDQWSNYLARKSCLPLSGSTDDDKAKIQLLKTTFISNLKKYNYSSITDFDRIDISDESLLPTIDGFDMKFDSSASDGIRLIWAFTTALLQVSAQKNGNHPGLIIIDEPAQQSIIPHDIDSFISSLLKLPNNSQILMAITLNSKELQGIIESLDENTFHQVNIVDKAFRQFSTETKTENVPASQEDSK